VKKIRKASKKLTLPMTLLILLAGCQNVDEYRKERIAKADKAFKEIKDKKLPQGAVLSLPYCIETALTNNLNMRVYDLKVAVNNEKRTAAALGMLPDVIVTNDLSVRSNEPGASSYSLLSGQESLEPSQSSQKWENRVRVEFLFSFIDFGLAYFNSVQARDRALIAEEERRRASQNLILDVSRAYFKVAAAQYAMENTEKMLSLADQTEQLLEEMVKNKKLPLEKVIIEKKTFLILKKSLMEYKRSYENSCIELRSLMGYYPSHELKVDTSGMKKLAELKVPDIELLEEIALLERPELFQLDIQQHITAISAKKKIIEMFPNVGIFTDFTNSTNKYLYNNSWWELGIRAAYRLLRVPQQVGEFVAIETEIDQITAQVTALSVGILSQVRIAHANLIEVKHRYALSEELYETYKSHEIVKEKQAKTSGSLSKIELNRIMMETAQKDIERTQALGNYYLAYFRLLNSVGLETLDSITIDKIKKRLNENFKNTQEEELERISVYKGEIQEYETKINELNKKLESLNTAAFDKESAVGSSDSQIAELQNKLQSDQEKVLQASETRMAEYNSKIDELTYKIDESKKSLKDNEAACDDKILAANREYDEGLAAYKESNSEDDSALKQLEEKHSSKVETAENDLEEITDSINRKIEDYSDQISEFQEKLEDEQDSLTDQVAEIKEKYEDQIYDISGSKEDHSESLAEIKAETAEYTKQIAELEKEKEQLITGLKESENTVSDHGNKLARYVAAMDLLDTANNPEKAEKPETPSKSGVDGIPALAPPDQSGESAAPAGAVTADDNLNMQVQEQSGESGGVNFLEYDPEATKNVDIQTQTNAGNNDINLMEYKPDTQNDINMQTQGNAGNNQINFQEFGSQLETGDDSIGNASQNNQIDEQLNKKLTE
jgi:outer membrane protein